MTAPKDFTIAGYRHLVETLLRSGYRPASFHDADPARQDLILRHDLDFSLSAALPIAEVEAEIGCRATYFVLMRSEMYNLFSPKASAVLARLQAMGHEIGLHLDASLYEDDPAALDDAAGRECDLLEKLTRTPVRIISFHRPAKGLLNADTTLAGRAHAYQGRYFKRMGYCSDSRGAWHHGPPLEHPSVAANGALQLLTHPIWWTSEFPGKPVETLDAFRRQRDRLTERELADNCEPYRDREMP